jgi:hypothetical protein
MVRRPATASCLRVVTSPVGVAMTALAQRSYRVASTQGMVSPCGSVSSTSLPWPFGHGRCDSHECWNDPNPVCTCQEDEWGMYWCNQKTYVEGYACRWDPFSSEDCVNTIVNGVCYYTSYCSASPVPGCVGDPYTTSVTRRDFCARP